MCMRKKTQGIELKPQIMTKSINIADVSEFAERIDI